jgi:thiosulfate/3-mercaptopyruvate sulfurtransferase
MKKIIAFVLVSFALNAFSQAPIWKKEQLMPTKDLAEKIKTNAKDKPLVLNVGPMEQIKTAVYVGKGQDVTTEQKIKSTLSMENKNRVVVVYCGCCSYANCPNIKPAYDALIANGFKNAMVLELPEGIKPDWVAKDYPMEETAK